LENLSFKTEQGKVLTCGELMDKNNCKINRSKDSTSEVTDLTSVPLSDFQGSKVKKEVEATY
jgi:hypothetical protein